MRRILLTLLALCAVLFQIRAQNRTVSGRVTDEKGAPLENVTVLIKNSTRGTTTNPNGEYSISVPSGSVLVFSLVGMGSREVPVDAQSAINVSLQPGSGSMQEVVVTALGIRRNKNTLPYAAQTVNGEDISQTRGNNFINSLSGKASGVEIRQSNTMGGSTNIVIRGVKSLLGSNQAMFVVDGVPIDNSNTTNVATALGRTNDANGRAVGGFDYGNAAADLNPDDIESVTVLKGAAASALYGSRAANGVVMVTTKKGRKGLGVAVNSGLIVGSMDKDTYPTYQKEYGAGYSSNYSTAASGSPNLLFWYLDPWGTGTKDLVVPTTEDASYGAKFDPNLQVYHWDAFDPASPNYRKKRPWVAAANDPTEFFETALTNVNSLVLDGGNDKGSFKIGYTRHDEKGILPNSRLLKNLFNLGTSYKVADQFTASASLNFSKIDGKGRFGTGYNDYNPNQQFRQWWQTNVDIKELEEAYQREQKNITWNWADPGKASGLYPIYSDNPYWTRYQNVQTDGRYRFFGNTSLTWTPTSWLNILGRISLDSYDEVQEERIAVGSNPVSSYSKLNRTFREYNYDLMANVDRDITSDLNLKGLLGTNLRRNRVSSTFARTNGGLFVPGLYSLSNSVSPIAAPDEVFQEIAVDGYFAGLTFGFREYLTLDLAGRMDRASTLPADNNSYFYPSISAGFLFSSLLKNTPWLSSGKLRLNYAETGNNAPWGSLADIYDKPAPYGGTTLFSLPDIKNNPELKPERTKSREIGVEMAFLRNRLGLDVTYYFTESVDQIMPVAISNATGYRSKYVNAGTIENQGIELSLFATPVRTRDFSWNMNVNWTRNRNEVVALYDGSTNLQINPLGMQGGVSINATLGQPYGTIQGRTWVRHENGEKLVGTNGRYVMTTTTNNVIGNINPDWTGGVYNTLRYKNLSLGFLVDVRKGGDVFSLDMYYGLATGLYPETVGLNDLGNPSRNPIAQGGGVIMPGVTADGKPNTLRVENVYGTYGYSFNPQEAFVYDASYVKLRELNLTYSLPKTVVSKLPYFKGIDFSIIGRNLWIIHKNLPYSDPEELISSGNIQGYQSGAYPTTRTLGANLKLTF